MTIRKFAAPLLIAATLVLAACGTTSNPASPRRAPAHSGASTATSKPVPVSKEQFTTDVQNAVNAEAALEGADQANGLKAEPGVAANLRTLARDAQTGVQGLPASQVQPIGKAAAATADTLDAFAVCAQKSGSANDPGACVSEGTTYLRNLTEFAQAVAPLGLTFTN